jgi:DNA-binding NtrC family response regulator
MTPRVIVFEAAGDDRPLLADVLASGGCEIRSASTAEALVDGVATGRYQAVLFAFSSDRPDDLMALRLFRRLAPDLPLVIVSSDASLEVRRLIQAMRPVYFAVRPVEAEELCDAVRDACVPPKHAGAAGEGTDTGESGPGRRRGRLTA